MEKRAEVKIQTNPKMADIIIQSLSPELNRKSFRVEVELITNPSKNELKLIVTAQDVNALRAALNSYLRWIKCVIEVHQELIGEGDINGNT